jgi:DNA-binding CsgD family transcriptional regulator
MNHAVVFTVASLALFAGFFSLGSCCALLLRQKTRVLKVALLFLASLLFLNLGFWAQNLPDGALPGAAIVGNAGTRDILAGIFQMLGVALTVVFCPVLVETLIAIPLPKPMRTAIAVWDGLLALACVSFPVAVLAAPGIRQIIIIFVNVQLALTIGASLAVLALRLDDVRPLATQKAVRVFLVGTGGFLAVFVADFLVTWFGVRQAAIFDNLGLPTYFLALNAGSFVFVARYLGSGPLIVRGKISPECRELYGMTAREIELAEKLLAGRSNQEIADELFISRKTVENHLYNIYQKLGVKNRVQFLRTLENHGQN